MTTMMATFLFLLISIATAGFAQLTRAANPATAVAGVFQPAQQLALLSSGIEGVSRGLQAAPSRKILQTSGSSRKELLGLITVGNIPAARRILDKGVDPNFQNEDGISPLIVAITVNNPEMIQLLIKFGADIYDFKLNSKKYRKTDALHFAALLGSTDAMAVFLKAGADIDKLDANGLSALHYAVFRERTAAATLLLDEGAVVDVLSTQLITPLYMAVSMKNLKMVKFLTAKGADVESLNTKHDLRPILAGVSANSGKIVQHLILAGADVNDQKERSPIYVAVYMGNIRPMKVLINNEADMSVKIDGKSLQGSLCGCTTDPDAEDFCNFSACKDPENMEALLD